MSTEQYHYIMSELRSDYIINENLLNMEEALKDQLWAFKILIQIEEMIDSEPTVLEILSLLNDDQNAEMIINGLMNLI